MLEGTKQDIYEGMLIKESVSDENILDYIQINKVEVWKTNNIPKYWTAIQFTSMEQSLPQKLAQVMRVDKQTGVHWFVDFKQGNIKYIVFKDTVLSYTIGNSEEKEKVVEECRKLGIPDTQMNWDE